MDRARRAIDRWLEDVPEYPGGEGAGVLIPAGRDYLIGAWVIIGLLRRLGCGLPVEIWHQGPDELTWVADAIARRFSGIEFRDIGRAGGAREKGGWQLKAEALARSSFRTVLLLDADNQPLIEPTALLLDPGFLETGTLFWLSPVDFIVPTNGAWRCVGLVPLNLPGLDSGQMLVDRERAWRGVALADFMNRHSETYWLDLFGDKDTFPLAWRRAGIPYSTIEKRPGLVGRSIYQFDRTGQYCFRHRFEEKWSIAQPPSRSDRSPGGELLAELRSLAAMNGAI